MRDLWNQLNHRLLRWVKWEKGLCKYASLRWLRAQNGRNPGLFAHWSGVWWIANEPGLIFFDRAKSTLKNFNIDSTFQVVWTTRTPQVFPDSQSKVWLITHGFEIEQVDPESDRWKLAPFANINGKPEAHSDILMYIYDYQDRGIIFHSLNFK